MTHVVHAVSEGRRFATDHSLEVVTCPSCRIVYAIPASLADSARAYPGGQPRGWDICCPMGHEWRYTGESIEQKLQKERQRLQATRDLLAAEERSHNATKGHLTRQKRRAAAGVCPCCNRTFQQLARHMKGQHPDFVDSPEGRLPADVDRQIDLGDSVVAFVGDGERRWAEIRDHLGISDTAAGNLIAKLADTGRLERVRRGIYRATRAG